MGDFNHSFQNFHAIHGMGDTFRYHLILSVMGGSTSSGVSLAEVWKDSESFLGLGLA